MLCEMITNSIVIFFIIWLPHKVLLNQFKNFHTSICFILMIFLDSKILKFSGVNGLHATYGLKRLNSSVASTKSQFRYLSPSLGYTKIKPAIIPCSECMKILDQFISQCALNEGFLKPIISLREFCETSVSADPSFTNRDFKYCLELGRRLSEKTGTNFAALHTNNHVMGSCSAFQNICHEYGGGWTCYSGLCDELAACTDCPYVMLQLAPQKPLQPEVCADRGECFIGSKKSNNGYCECDKTFRGLACDQYVNNNSVDG